MVKTDGARAPSKQASRRIPIVNGFFGSSSGSGMVGDGQGQPQPTGWDLVQIGKKSGHLLEEYDVNENTCGLDCKGCGLSYSRSELEDVRPYGACGKLISHLKSLKHKKRVPIIINTRPIDTYFRPKSTQPLAASTPQVKEETAAAAAAAPAGAAASTPQVKEETAAAVAAPSRGGAGHAQQNAAVAVKVESVIKQEHGVVKQEQEQ